MKRDFEAMGINLHFCYLPQKLQDLSRPALAQAIDFFKQEQVDLVLALFPDQLSSHQQETTDQVYDRFKSMTLQEGLTSQVVRQKTLKNTYAVGNVILGILAKTGNIPYILATPLPFADVIVGLDVARNKKKNLPGSVNAIAATRIFLNNGEFLHYQINESPLEGETIPQHILQSLLPAEHMAGKRVIIHRDGLLRGHEKTDLAEWGKQIGATFHWVEVNKSKSPRLYQKSVTTDEKGQNSTSITQPPKGTVCRLSNTEALLVSSLPLNSASTPQPLHLRTDLALGIDHAIASVLALTYLHYGSDKCPRLPVSIHYGDRIGYLTLRGIKPQNFTGVIPYWL